MIDNIPTPRERGWWLEEALADDPGEPCPALTAEISADVLIVGGGYTGMWTALHLKDRDPGVDVVLLEQDICGGGPSGRNGGFCNGWNSLAEIAELFGDGPALEMGRAGSESIAEIGKWCEDNGVDAWFRHAGDLGIATSPAQDGAWRPMIEEAERFGLSDRYAELTPEEVRKRCDSPVFGGGVFAEDAATVQPARLARGMRRVLLERGVRIFEQTPVSRFRGGPPAEAETPDGSVRAEHAVLAVNAWASQWKAFRRIVMVRGSYIVITAPAPERLEEIGWTGGEAIWDFRAAVHYLRTTPDGRIAFGCGGMQPDLGRRIGPGFVYDERFVKEVAEDLWRMFPSFREVPLESAWGGPIDVAGNHLPFFGTLPGGNVHYGFGYTGNGTGPSHLGGRILSAFALGVEDAYTRLPIAQAEPRKFPPEPFRSPGGLIANQAILRKDRAEDAGRRPNPLVSFVARMPRRLGFRLGP